MLIFMNHVLRDHFVEMSFVKSVIVSWIIEFKSPTHFLILTIQSNCSIIN